MCRTTYLIVSLLTALVLVYQSAASRAQEAFSKPVGEPQFARYDYPAAKSTEYQPTQADYQRLLQRLDATDAELRALRGNLGQVDRLPPVVDTKRIYADGNPNVPSAEQRLSALERLQGGKDGPHFPSVRLTGFFHLDAGWYSQDPTSQLQYGNMQDGVGFRRARLQAVGSVTEFTNYSIEMDFATAGRPSFMDVWAEQTHVPLVGNVRAGHFRQPFSMDALTSVRQLEFLERSAPFQAFVPFRRVGVMAYDKSDNELWSWAYGVYKTGGFNNAPLGDSRNATDIGDGTGYSFSGRATHLLWYDEPAEGRYLLHVGGGYNYSRISHNGDLAGTPGNNSDIYQARSIPEFFVGDPAGGGLTAVGTPTMVDTGRLLANEFNLYGLEIAGQYGPAHFQGEYMSTVVNQIGNAKCLYDGAYLQAGYFLTGEHRTYNKMFGVFDRITPFSDFFGLGRDKWICGWGAWEATVRWSYLNLLSANAAPLAGIAGPPVSPNPGILNESTVGLNWYLNSFSKVQFNWIHAIVEGPLFGRSNTDIYATRLQLEF